MSATEFTRADVAAFVERIYSLSSAAVQAIPGGHTSRCFHVRCPGGAWVLKIRVAGGAGPSGSSLGRSLRLISEMTGLRPALRLPEPAPTRRGALTARLPGGGAALYRFVACVPAPHLADAPASLAGRIGEAAAEIHALTPRLTVEIPHGRPRQLARLRRLDRTLSALPRLSGQGAARLRAAAGPHIGALRRQLRRLASSTASSRMAAPAWSSGTVTSPARTSPWRRRPQPAARRCHLPVGQGSSQRLSRGPPLLRPAPSPQQVPQRRPPDPRQQAGRHPSRLPAPSLPLRRVSRLAHPPGASRLTP